MAQLYPREKYPESLSQVTSVDASYKPTSNPLETTKSHTKTPSLPAVHLYWSNGTYTPSKPHQSNYYLNQGTGAIYIGTSRDLNQDDLEWLDNMQGGVAVVYGDSGVGKTTFALHLAECYKRKSHLQRYRRFLHINKPDIIDSKDYTGSLEDLLEPKNTESNLSRASLLVLIECDSEFSETLGTNSIIRGILSKKILKEATILVVCNTSQVQEVESITTVGQYYKLCGFSENAIVEYYRDSCVHWEQLLSYLKIIGLADCPNPRICSIIVQIVGGQTFKIPTTTTDFIYKIVCRIIWQSLDQEEREALLDEEVKLEDLPESAEAIFETICSLALKHIQTGHTCTSYGESRQFLSSFSLGLSKLSLKRCFQFGLIECSPNVANSRYAYMFVHPSITEFLAAFSLHSSPPINQLKFLFDNIRTLFESGFRQWLPYFFGLTADVYASQNSMYNATKLMMNPVIDVVVETLALRLNSQYRCSLIRCLHETQETSLLRKLASKYSLLLTFSVNMKVFNKCLEPVVSLINNSGCLNWLLTTCSNLHHLALSIQAKAASKNLVRIVIDESIKERIDISTRRNRAEVDQAYRETDQLSEKLSTKEKIEKLNHNICRAVREILQRVLPLYSPVKLKGDSSNVSYVSFLTCHCFKGSFSNCMKLLPLQAIHYLDGPKKDIAKLKPDSLTLTDRHNAAEHGGQSMEVVLMLRPFPEKFEGIVPSTDTKFNLVLSHGLSTEENPGAGSAISDTSEKYVTIEKCMDDYDVTRDNTEIILPSIHVIPKILTGRAQHALPKPFVHPTKTPQTVAGLMPTTEIQNNNDEEQGYDTRYDSEVPMSGGVLQQSNYQVQAQITVQSQMESSLHRIQSQRLRLNRRSPAETGGATSVQPLPGVFINTYAGEQQALGQAQPVLKRQTALKPGTVLLTSLADKIPSDRIQPLPTQQHLIRKGGNGSIYSENIDGMAVAVKKTSYRSKEYAIIGKIRHKNIIPLLAYVWGEEHEQNKRRYYVYHYLPKLSGDLARLVTDKEELCLYKFHKANEYNVRALGIAVGNIKYILGQVLRGVQYLHEVHRIAHRDLKASNVLIKFFCGCEQPVQCSCEIKYQVVICDYDAAIELDSNQQLPPTTAHSSRTQSHQLYEIVPVGTNGFRSPEGSMLILSNSPDTFSPPLSTKTDIYSFGILAMRLMMSTDTPYSQRAMSTLLLYYHLKKGVSEGRVRSPGVWRVDGRTVNKLLKLNKLYAQMGWLSGAYEFVSKCLSVDPRARPTASQLLSDSFIHSS